MEYALKVKDLCKHYPDFSLDHVNFTLPGGCIMGFIGENGAGKTTAIKAILNLVNYQGKIEIMGMDPRTQEREIKRNIGVVLDNSYFYNELRPCDLPKMLESFYPTFDRALYDHYLSRFDLPSKKTIKTLSKGMLAKLQLVTAISHRPKLLILDEPTSGLDPVVRSEMLDLFMDFIQDEEHSILLSSHITSDLERIADYITFIHQGKILLTGSKDSLLEHCGILRCAHNELPLLLPEDIFSVRKHEFGCEVLVKDRQRAKQRYQNMAIDSATLDEIMVFMVRGNAH